MTSVTTYSVIFIKYMYKLLLNVKLKLNLIKFVAYGI